MATVLGQVTPVAKHSDEFTRVEHLLQVRLANAAARSALDDRPLRRPRRPASHALAHPHPPAPHHPLQLSCRSTAVKDIAAWSISNPHLSVQYERRAQGMLAVDCWVDINSLDESNPVQEVCKRGFHMPDTGSGLDFSTGNIRLDPAGPGACPPAQRHRPPPAADARHPPPMCPSPSPPPPPR